MRPGVLRAVSWLLNGKIGGGMIQIIETLTWKHTSQELPDADLIVLASHPSWPYESWPCFLDADGSDDCWRFDGGTECDPQPTLWTELPRGASVETETVPT